MKHTIYGPGGFDPDAEGGNVVAVEEAAEPTAAPTVGAVDTTLSVVAAEVVES